MIARQVGTNRDMAKKLRKTTLKAPPNNLRVIRSEEGLKITELAQLSDVSTKTITSIEYRNRNVSPEMKHRVVKGLNQNPRKVKQYKYSDVFPHEEATHSEASRRSTAR